MSWIRWIWHFLPWACTLCMAATPWTYEGKAGTQLAGSHHRHVWGGLEEQGLTSLDLGEVKTLLTLLALGHPSLELRPLMAARSATSETSSMTLCGRQRENLWEEQQGNREREQGAYLGHASAASSPGLRCSNCPPPPRLSERGEGKEKGDRMSPPRWKDKVGGKFFSLARGRNCRAYSFTRHSFHPLSLPCGPYQGWERVGLIFRGRLECPRRCRYFPLQFSRTLQRRWSSHGGTFGLTGVLRVARKELDWGSEVPWPNASCPLRDPTEWVADSRISAVVSLSSPNRFLSRLLVVARNIGCCPGKGPSGC